MAETQALVLASQSPARARLLAAAGLEVTVDPARIGEAEIRDGLVREGAQPHEIADALAELKACRTSHRHGPAFVIGADQILYCDGEVYAKPDDRAAARAQLQALRGRSHRLYTAVVVARQGEPIWRHYASPSLTMRSFSDAFLDWYLEAVGDDGLSSVGAYQLEGLGSQLFERYEGDYFSILGLPLLPLLSYLREHEVVRT